MIIKFGIVGILSNDLKDNIDIIILLINNINIDIILLGKLIDPIIIFLMLIF